MDRKTCDVVVIGAGIGGLCLATRLAHAGYKVIVTERMPILGGRFTYVNHNGYLLPTGAIGIYYGDKDPVLHTLRDVGVNVDLETKAFPPPSWRFGGQEYQMPEVHAPAASDDVENSWPTEKVLQIQSDARRARIVQLKAWIAAEQDENQ